MNKKNETATFAGGCFWCIEDSFRNVKGVTSVYSGYTGGKGSNPTYESVSSGESGHFEAVQMTYDSSIISYEELLLHFFRQIDPFDEGGQFYDRGSQYRTAIFWHNENQREISEKVIQKLEQEFQRKIVTKLIKYKEFFKAEEYHQGYSKKCPIKYNVYKIGSGRGKMLEEIWKDIKLK